MKSQFEIINEIKKLRTIKENTSINHSTNTIKSIDAQIDVLQNRIDDVYSYAEDNLWNDNLTNAALEASDWLFENDKEPPNEMWMEAI